MSAKEMFEKLGYKEIDEKNKIIYKKQEGWYYYYICFKLIKKTIYKSKGVCGKDAASSITLEELQAINKQIEELGWDK